MQAAKNLARVSLVIGIAITLFVVGQAAVAAQTVTQGYSSDSSLQKGTIVKLKTGNNQNIEPLTTKTVAQMQGVVVAANDAPVTLSSSNPALQQYYVATIGQYDVLVSDQNGPIKTGDYITISSLEGVGMKADSSQSVVLGKADASFNGGSATLSTVTIGRSKVNIGRISVTIAISHNPLLTPVLNNIPSVLQRAGLLVTSKPVNPIRLYTSFIVLIASLLVTASMLYSGIRSSLVAVGRNPLAKTSIMRNLLQVIATSLVVFILGLFAVYLILKL
jgi:hypothetical protein